MKPMETAYDRSKKKGGFISGPNHAMLKAGMMRGGDEPEQDDNPEEEQDEPPGLHNAMESAQICGNCKNFQGTTCRKFGGYPVKFHQSCDAWEPAGDDSEEMSGDSDAGMMRDEEQTAA